MDGHAARLRRDLHRNPELSGEERETARRIREEMERAGADRIQDGVGGHGVVAEFDGGGAGPAVLLRAELDALPQDETLDIPHASARPGAAHKCGHDGHMAVLVSVARSLGRERPSRGRVVLLFQPAEETGEGAARVRADPAFRLPEHAISAALHNLPGFPRGTVVVREGTFAFGSVGVEIALQGQTSHAAEPEKGRSPAPALAEMISRFGGLAAARDDGSLLTVVHARLGEPTFGTTPGSARLLATLRSPTDEGLDGLRGDVREIAEELAARHGLGCEVEWRDPFPATRNDAGVAAAIEAAARACDLPVHRPDEPFRWSEDFGHFTAAGPGALFGLGAGVDHPALHSPGYDFPDELIETGSRLLVRLARDLTGGTS